MTTKRKQASDASRKRLRASGKRKAQSAKCKAQNATTDAASATIESQIAFLESQIAMLQAQSAKYKVQSGGDEKTNTLRSPLPDPIALPSPPIMPPTVGSNCIHLEWGKVNNASGYIIEASKNSTFSNPVTQALNAAVTSWRFSGLQPDTTYYLRIMSIGTGLYANSMFSPVPPVTTLADGETGNDTIGNLQDWLAELLALNARFIALLPQTNGEVLSPAQRRRLLGSGVRRYGYIEKVADTSAEYPQFWPAFAADAETGTDAPERLREMLGRIEILRNLLIAFRFGVRVTEDLLFTAGDDAFRLANIYYRNVRDAARANIPEAAEVFQMLRLFWRRQRRNSSNGETVEPELICDARVLMHGTDCCADGTKDGE